MSSALEERRLVPLTCSQPCGEALHSVDYEYDAEDFREEAHGIIILEVWLQAILPRYCWVVVPFSIHASSTSGSAALGTSHNRHVKLSNSCIVENFFSVIHAGSAFACRGLQR